MGISGSKRRSALGPGGVNPRQGEIEVAWDAITAALRSWDGAEVARLFGDLFADQERDAVGNACWVRLDAWLVQWFRSRGLGRSEQFPGEDFSRDAMISWLRSIYTDGRPQPELLRPIDLAFVVQELREHGLRLDSNGRQP